jgi:hypothetical protein
MNRTVSAPPAPRRGLSQLSGGKQPVQGDDDREHGNRHGWREQFRESEPEQDDRDDEGAECTLALRRFNDHVAQDGRVICVMLTIRDGVTLIRRREGA